MTHRELTARAVRWLGGTRRATVILTEQGFGTEVCDVLGWANVLVVVECKTSRADFLADLRKGCRRFVEGEGDRGLGRERWYFAPRGVLRVDEIPARWGLLEWTGSIVRRRKPAPLLEGDPEMWRKELAIVLAELRRYQAQGIRYRRL